MYIIVIQFHFVTKVHAKNFACVKFSLEFKFRKLRLHSCQYVHAYGFICLWNYMHASSENIIMYINFHTQNHRLILSPKRFIEYNEKHYDDTLVIVVEVEQLFTVLEQWRIAVPKINWAWSRSNHTKCYPPMWLILMIIHAWLVNEKYIGSDGFHQMKSISNRLNMYKRRTCH